MRHLDGTGISRLATTGLAQCAKGTGIARTAPRGELGGVQPLATQQRTDLPELDSRISLLDNAQLVGCREATTSRPFQNFGVC